MRSRQAPAARSSGIGLGEVKRKTHPISVSGEDERPAHAAGHEGRPNTKGDDEGLRPLQFPGVHDRETNRYEDQGPNRENVERLAERDEPFSGFVGQKCRQIRGNRIFKVSRAVRLQIEDEDEERTANQPRQKSM